MVVSGGSAVLHHRLIAIAPAGAGAVTRSRVECFLMGKGQVKPQHYKDIP